MNEYPCIDCGSNVRPRQEALQCDQCSQWQHRLCNTGKTKIICKICFTSTLNKTLNWIELKKRVTCKKKQDDFNFALYSRESDFSWYRARISPTSHGLVSPGSYWIYTNVILTVVYCLYHSQHYLIWIFSPENRYIY